MIFSHPVDYGELDIPQAVANSKKTLQIDSGLEAAFGGA